MNEFEDLIKALDAYISKADDDLTDKLNEEGYAKAAETVENINALEDAIAEILEEELEYYLGELEGVDLENAVNNILPNLLAGDITDEKLAEVFKDIFDKALRSLTDAYIKDIDKDLAFSMFSERTSDWIKSWSEELGKLMKLGSYEELQRILSKGLEDGESVQQVMENLMDSYGFSRKRARATAITEMLTAHSVSSQEAYRQSPAVEKKMWRHTGAHKNKPRQNHVNMDGKKVDKNEPFELLGADGETYHPDYPRDPILPPSERVNCHCISQPIVSESILGLSLEERRKLQQQAIDDDNALWEAELDAKNKAKAGIE
jgi:hypothetical protein